MLLGKIRCFCNSVYMFGSGCVLPVLPTCLYEGIVFKGLTQFQRIQMSLKKAMIQIFQNLICHIFRFVSHIFVIDPPFYACDYFCGPNWDQRLSRILQNPTKKHS